MSWLVKRKTSVVQPPDPMLGMVFQTINQTFEVPNPTYEPPTGRASVARVHRRSSFSSVSELIRGLHWLSPTGWASEIYSTPYPALVVTGDARARLAKRGVDLLAIGWPGNDMTTADYCGMVPSGSMELISSPHARLNLFLKEVATPVVVSWDGEPANGLTYRIEGQDFYNLLIASSKNCPNGWIDVYIRQVDFNRPIEGVIPMYWAGDPWVEDVEVKFSPFYRDPLPPSISQGVTSMMAYITD